MRKVKSASDMTGRKLNKGDTVMDVNGQITGRICDIADDEGTFFVRLRPVHQPYAHGVWYAADRVLWLAQGRRRRPAKA